MLDRCGLTAFLLLLATLYYEPYGVSAGEDFSAMNGIHRTKGLLSCQPVNQIPKLSSIYATCDDLDIDGQKKISNSECGRQTARVFRTRNHIVRYVYDKKKPVTVSITLHNINGFSHGSDKDIEVNNVRNPENAFMADDAIFFSNGYVNVSSAETIREGVQKEYKKEFYPKNDMQVDVFKMMRFSVSRNNTRNFKTDLVSAGYDALNYHQEFDGQLFSTVVHLDTDTKGTKIKSFAGVVCVGQSKIGDITVLPIVYRDIMNKKYNEYSPIFDYEGKDDPTKKQGCPPQSWERTLPPFVAVCVLGGTLSSITLMVVLYMIVWRIPRIKRRIAAAERANEDDTAKGGRRTQRHKKRCRQETTGEQCDCGGTDDDTGDGHSNEGKDGTGTTKSSRSSKHKGKSKKKAKASKKA
ncbi:hypothetical protein QR680_018230 [Steinernema hermaphroditum]|uniref:Uncharacterized protein n=1 Tax=Steinernema hermaphroditum TaxID=289476 RepID=A0AA39LQN8_9BILA|nr:hypothetical protein QR680_018230 [Steinernema hermaphroditum]